jgi:hypothetical protein
MRALADTWAFDRSAKGEGKRTPILDAQTGERLFMPSLLLSLDQDRAMSLFFDGLRMHHIDAIASGKLEEWKAVGRSVIELCGTVSDARLHKRADMQA